MRTLFKLRRLDAPMAGAMDFRATKARPSEGFVEDVSIEPIVKIALGNIVEVSFPAERNGVYSAEYALIRGRQIACTVFTIIGFSIKQGSKIDAQLDYEMPTGSGEVKSAFSEEKNEKSMIWAPVDAQNFKISYAGMYQAGRASDVDIIATAKVESRVETVSFQIHAPAYFLPVEHDVSLSLTH